MPPSVRPLPGIRIDVASPPATDSLPRMDIAVLVGFASTGPLHLPVAIEGVGQYAAVFGADAPLAWDRASGERVTAYLGDSVRAFFANGGRRCWVIRVARSATAEALRRARNGAGGVTTASIATTSRFAMPGVLAVSQDGSVGIALAEAASEGSWADDLQISAALTEQGFGIEALAAASPARSIFFRTRYALQVGDLLLLGDSAATCAYSRVDSVAASASRRGFDVEAEVCAAFERFVPFASPALDAEGAVTWAEFIEPAASTPPLLPTPATLSGTSAGQASLQLREPVSVQDLGRSNWARWSNDAETVWLRIDETERATGSASSGSSSSAAAFLSPPSDPTRFEAVLIGPAWRELGPMLPDALAGATQARVLTLDLRADGSALAARLGGVGLTPDHRASWWLQPSDADRYRLPDGTRADGPATAQTARPFPLAATASPPALAWLPLGVEPVFGAALGPLPQSASALERDGLADFDADLFLDPDLASTGVESLIAEADGIRVMAEVPRPLLGIHAALGIASAGVFGEASLIAVPDAVHLGWQPRPLADVGPAPAVVADAPGQWQAHRGACMPTVSNLDAPDFSAFIDCATRRLSTPLLLGPALPVLPGVVRLSWITAERETGFILEEAVQADFSDARVLYSGTATGFTVELKREGIYRYRVRAELGDERSDASNVVNVQVRSSEWQQIDPQALSDDARTDLETQWLIVQRAVLRIAAASGELFAVLALPRHFRTPQALRHAERLRSVLAPTDGGLGDPSAFGAGEARALSYGALFHPWLQADRGAPQVDPLSGNVIALQGGAPRVVPADGASLGVLAARAAERGAWIAPANEPLKDVVALAPAVPDGDRQALQDAAVNILGSDPRGLYAMSADTLSLDAELRPINVRRLLILLRRLALLRGTRYVFEPHGPVLRRAVQRGFDELLGDLFRRGAFAGATAEQSFRVVTDDTLNTPADVDAGRFFVELRVAPALPLRFIVVQLSQSGERLSVVEAP